MIRISASLRSSVCMIRMYVFGWEDNGKKKHSNTQIEDGHPMRAKSYVLYVLWTMYESHNYIMPIVEYEDYPYVLSVCIMNPMYQSCIMYYRRLVENPRFPSQIYAPNLRVARTSQDATHGSVARSQEPTGGRRGFLGSWGRQAARQDT